LDELSWFITLVSEEEFLPICHRKIAELKENSLLPDAGSRNSPAKPSRLFSDREWNYLDIQVVSIELSIEYW